MLVVVRACPRTWIGVGMARRPPLPPNRTGGFPASGSPVGGLWAQVGTLTLWLRLRRLARAACGRHRPTASNNCSCEFSRQPCRPHLCCATLPCLARGTRGSLGCSDVALMFPPSYPPWLHGRYSLHRYYGDSDSCPAPSSTRTGILDYLTCISGHSVSTHPMRPRLPAILLVPGGLGLRLALDRYRRFFWLSFFLPTSLMASCPLAIIIRVNGAPTARRHYTPLHDLSITLPL